MEKRFPVPFIPQEHSTDCAPVCLRMVAEYFGHPISPSTARDLVRSVETGFTWTIGIALGAAKLGYNVTFLSEIVSPTDETYSREIDHGYISEIEKAKQTLQKMLREAESLNIQMRQQTLSLQQLLLSLNRDQLVIPLINSNVLYGRDGYQGHFLVIVGCTESEVIVHEPGQLQPTAFKAIPFEQFDLARKSPGTDQDLVIISNASVKSQLL